MDNDKNTQPGRASLRGKGRKILLGDQAGQPAADDAGHETAGDRRGGAPDVPQAIDPSSLSLDPDETEALLDFSTDEPPFDPEQAFPDPVSLPPDDSFPADAADARAFSEPESPDRTGADWAYFEWEDTGDADLAPHELDMPDSSDTWEAAEFEQHEGLEEQQHTITTPRTVRQPPHHGDAMPLGERPSDTANTFVEGPYASARVLDALVPGAPEVWDEHDGGAIEAASVEPPPQPAAPLVHDPFVPHPERPASEELFDQTAPSDPDLMELLIDDNRIQRLLDRIEQMQEELATDFHADRATVDTLQRELLQASGMLLESRDNYDDARAIVYRIRTDMNRQRKIDADIRRYRPLLLNYYVGWVIALGVLFLLKALFTGVTDAVGIESAAAMYYPTLLGAGGALISGFMTLERHTTRLRDFDPIHISWYLYNPLLGAVMGLLMFLIASIANEDLLRETASDAEHAITYLLCVVAGMNQNNVLHRLNDLLKRFGRGNHEGTDADRS